MTIGGAAIQTVSVVDDNPDARETYLWTLEDAHLRGIDETGPLGSLESFSEHVRRTADAVLCDQHLQIKNYAGFDGAALVATLFDLRIPAVLCTRWEQAHLLRIRPFRAKIPVMLSWDELDPESLKRSFETVISEINGQYSASRRSWRTQVHIADIDNRGSDSTVYVDVPGWTSDDIVQLPASTIPFPVRIDQRLHARVNLGAEASSELFFTDWERP